MKAFKFQIIFAIIFATFAATLASLNAFDAEIDFSDIPSYVQEDPGVEFLPEITRAGSLFGSGERPLFADRRAMKPDDLITIIISESASSNFSTNKTYNGASGGVVTPPNIQYTGTNEEQQKITQDLNDMSAYTLNRGANTQNFTGGGNQNHSDNINAVVTARIIKVLENGNYFIAGQKEILVDGEKQILQVSGVVRPYDVQKDNSVESKYMADAKIAYYSIGAISNTRSKAPATDGIESLYPF